MPEFRKNPVAIEASLWLKNGDHPQDYTADRTGFENGILRTFPGDHAKEHRWEGGVVRYFRRPDVSGDTACKHCAGRMHDHGWIDTLEGGHIVCPGDWIITGVKGEVYPCKPDIFAASYSPATSPDTPNPAVADGAVETLAATEADGYRACMDRFSKGRECSAVECTCVTRATRRIAALHAAGYVVVPREATEQMLRAADKSMAHVNGCIQIAAIHHCPLVWEDDKPPLWHAYAAMIAASDRPHD